MEIDSIQLRYGTTWGNKLGGDGGTLTVIDLLADEYITGVTGTYMVLVALPFVNAK